jgi:hypothetical protein
MAVDSAHTNPDLYLDRLSNHFAEELEEWGAQTDGSLDTSPGCLAAGSPGR